MKMALALILIFLSIHSYALESQLLGDVDQLPVNYRIVKTCGGWSIGARAGYYRLVVDIYDGAGSEIYVQWIASATIDYKAKLMKTLAISEFNDDHSQYWIQAADCEKKRDGMYIDVKALHEHDEKEKIHHFSVRLIDIGEYKLIGIEMISNLNRKGRSWQMRN